ncbi:MAG: hypothetical protein ACYTG3_07220 [Planctomycetota bacterium]|jgi:uncharacterized membrane protein
MRSRFGISAFFLLSTSLVGLLVSGCDEEKGNQQGNPPPGGQPQITTPPGELPATYKLVILNTLGGQVSSAMAVGRNCEIIGHAELADQKTGHAVMQLNGVVTDLGTQGGQNSLAVGATPVGHVLIESEVDPTSEASQVFVRRFDGSITPLPPVQSGHRFASAINNLGNVVGIKESGTESAYFWNGSQDVNLPGLVPNVNPVRAHDINNNNIIVGESRDAMGRGQPVVWEGSGPPLALNTLPGFASGAARGINDNQDIVGASRDNLSDRATFWQSNPLGSWEEPVDLGLLPGGLESAALDINAHRVVVGWADRQVGGSSFRVHAIVWTQNDGLVNLNDRLPAGAGLTLTEARAITNDGKIVGFGRTAQGQRRGFLLVPP